MGMFDHYEPVPDLHCPACGAVLDGWQGKDADCALFTWRQGQEAPVGQEVPDDIAALPEARARFRLPGEFEIYTNCCGGSLFVTARCATTDGRWTSTEVETAETARQRSYESRADFRRRLAWLRGEAARAETPKLREEESPASAETPTPPTGDESSGLALHEPGYFQDAREAVERTTTWLLDGNWVELARHYDLSGTDVPMASLVRGEFFVGGTPPEVGHPGGFARFREPFPPGFRYQSHRLVGQDLVQVRVGISIEMGQGAPPQEGWTTFLLRRSERGLQLVPAARGTPSSREPAAPGGPPGELRPS